MNAYSFKQKVQNFINTGHTSPNFQPIFKNKSVKQAFSLKINTDMAPPGFKLNKSISISKHIQPKSLLQNNYLVKCQPYKLNLA